MLLSSFSHTLVAEQRDQLTRAERRVLIMAAECAAGVGDFLADQLAMLRDGVTNVEGNDLHVGKLLAASGPDDTALVIDQRRYDLWVLNALKLIAGSGAYIVSFSAFDEKS